MKEVVQILWKESYKPRFIILWNDNTWECIDTPWDSRYPKELGKHSVKGHLKLNKIVHKDEKFVREYLQKKFES